MIRKLFRCILGLLAIAVLAGAAGYALRVPLMKGMGNYLIDEDSLEKAPVAFVLGGGAYDRASEAAGVYHEGYVPRLVCTSENVPHVFDAIDDAEPLAEAELTKDVLLRQGVPEEAVIALKKGTSTKEEAEIVMNYCRKNKLDKVIVITSKFHTRRVRGVFEPLLRKNNIELFLRGAPSTEYSEGEWWKSEKGMIMVNNEFMKLIYYFVKY